MLRSWTREGPRGYANTSRVKYINKRTEYTIEDFHVTLFENTLFAADPLLGMPSESPTIEPSEWPFPPLPTRNPLRDDPLYKGKSRLLQVEPEGDYMAPASPISQDIFNELDRELKDTQQRLVSALYEGDKVQSRNKSPGEHTPQVRGRRVSKSGDYDACTVMESLMAEAELEESSSDDEMSNFRLSSETSAIYKQPKRENQGRKTVKGIKDFAPIGSVRRCQIDRAAEPSPTTPDSNSDPALPCTATTGEDEDAPHPGAWLAGELSQELQAAEQSLRLSRDLSFTSSRKQYALSPFPPASPRSGLREYVPPNSPLPLQACPLSPLNNGRDAYGNHIPSDTRDLSMPRSDLVTLIPLPDKRSTLGQDGPPQVHLRGGWELPRPFWRRSGYADPYQARDPPDGHGKLRAVGYEDTADPNTKSPVGARTPQRAAVTNRRDHGASVRGDQGKTTHSPQQRKPSDLTNENSYENLSLIFNKHFGIQRVPPVSAIDNPRTKVYKHLDIPTWTGPSSPPIDATSVFTNTTTGALQPPEFPIYRPTPPHLTGGRPESLASLGTTTASQSVQSAPRQEKRWDKELSRPPPKDPAPIYPEEIDFYLAGELGSQDNESIFSARTADDRLQGLVELQTSGPYRKAKQLREARRILEEQERRRRQEEQRERDIDAHTITPSMSISTRHVRRQPLPRGDTYKPGMGIVPEDESYNSSRRNLPRQNTHEQFMHQQFPQPGAAAADPAPPPVTTAGSAPLMEPAGVRNDTTRPNMNSMEMAFHIAGKVTRFLLAAPSDPKVKTYSKRYPPPTSSDQRQAINAPPLRTTNTSALERISDGAPHNHHSQTQVQRETRGGGGGGPKNDIMEDNTTARDKGKGKARDPVDTPRYTLDSTFSGSTAVPSNARYTGNTLPAGGPSAQLRGVLNESRRGGLQIPQQRIYEEESDAGTTWPEQDSQGNVWAGGAHIRGGDGGSNSDYAVGMDVRSSFSAASSVVGGDKKDRKLMKKMKSKSKRVKEDREGKEEERNEEKRKERKEKKKSAWGNREYALAMHSMG
ncbi:hypothetical protein N0V83_008809 [Neocucurbitaria cava]|uniref:Uncharacterized protein n=1 Tax=Neocucurbitaria cava TaxID=798079 RepID=A0A9W9CIA5_9PLEO|nr:hypothetical protein N0V83_008809 [Neocucurbitaria cava]